MCMVLLFVGRATLKDLFTPIASYNRQHPLALTSHDGNSYNVAGSLRNPVDV